MRRQMLAGLVGTVTLLAFGGGVPSSALGGAADPLPRRPARPVPPVSWSAFAPVREDSLPELPIRSSTQRSRWSGLRLTLRGADTQSPTAAPGSSEQPGTESGSPSPATVSLAGESSAFQTAFADAVARAREDDAAGCRTALAPLAPRTVEGETAVGRLGFAAAVAAGDRQTAEEIFSRLSWADEGRTAARLEAWRRLEAGEGSLAEVALENLINPTPGERAAQAMGRWQAHFRGAGSPGEDWMEVEGLPRVAMGLAAGAQAAGLGDAEGASRPLLGLRGAAVPEPWQSAFQDLSEPGGSSDPSRDDVASYREAAELFLAGRDEAAASRLGDFLAQWPNSTHRPLAYLLRAHLHVAAGERGEAEADLDAVERPGVPLEILDRAQVLRAFLLAQRGNHGDAQAALAKVMAGSSGAKTEGELRFDRVRLLRLAGDGPGAEAAILEIEEAFPDEPWAKRARADGEPKHWREPWRSRPAEPQARRDISAPTEGPWGLLLWGEFVLSREAENYSEVAIPGAGGISAAAGSEPGGSAGVDSTGRRAYLEAGLGGPPFGSLGAGVGGSAAGFLYRVEAGQLFAEKRHELPKYRRTDWEIAGARLKGPVRFGVALEGTGRTDDEAPALGLNPDIIDAYTWVARTDVGFGDLDHTGLTASVSRLSGDVDAGGSGTWSSKETWFELRGSLSTGTLRWEGHERSASLDHEQPGSEETPWFHDLRLVAKNPAGWYLGGRAGLYKDRGLVLPVAGIDHRLGSWQTWIKMEPRLSLPGFRETFVANGDWNVPDFSIPAERRTLDLEGGLSSRNAEDVGLTLEARIYQANKLRTWRRSGYLWQEDATTNAEGLELQGSGTVRLGSFLLSGDGLARSLRAEDRPVPYVPSLLGGLELGYQSGHWRAGSKLLGVTGREDETGSEYGSFLRWDLEGALEIRSPVFLLSDRIEIAARVENLTGVEDRRWPGVPGYGRGVFLGVRTLYGTPGGM